MRGDGKSTGTEGATGEENNLSSPARGDAASPGAIFHHVPRAVNMIQAHGGT